MHGCPEKALANDTRCCSPPTARQDNDAACPPTYFPSVFACLRICFSPQFQGTITSPAPSAWVTAGSSEDKPHIRLRMSAFHLHSSVDDDPVQFTDPSCNGRARTQPSNVVLPLPDGHDGDVERPTEKSISSSTFNARAADKSY